MIEIRHRETSAILFQDDAPSLQQGERSLRGQNLAYAQLDGADLHGADLRGVDLCLASNGARLRDAALGPPHGR